MTIADKLIFSVTLGGVLGCGLMAGIFFAFSTFIMKALALLSAEKGMAAMQSINATILNPVFFTAFFGTALVCVLAIVFAFLRWSDPGSAYLLAGGVLYLIGNILVTALFNVPMNEALASATAASRDGANLWAGYLMRWTAWNHFRTVTALAATISFALALYHRAQAASH